MDFVTEAVEAAGGSSTMALLNLRWQVANEESAGVIDMYEDAAIGLGASQQHVTAAKLQGRGDWFDHMIAESSPISGPEYMQRMYRSLACSAREGRYNPETGLPN